jgi:hypothetical protein
MSLLNAALRIALPALLPVVLTACIGRHPVAIAPTTVPGTYTVLGPVEESDCGYALLMLLPIGGRDEPHEIIDRLVKEKGADALVAVTVEQRNMYAILWASSCTIVNGQAIKITR